MQVKTLIRVGESERVHGRFKTSPHVHKLCKRVDTNLLRVRLHLLHVGLRRQVKVERDAISESAGDAVKLELPFIPHRHAQRFKRVFNERAFRLFCVGVGLPVVDAANNVRDGERVRQSVVYHVVHGLQVQRVVARLERYPHEFAGSAGLMGHRVNRDHVVDDAVVVACATERAFEPVAVTLEVLGVFRYDAEHSSGNGVVAEEATFIVGNHIVNVGPFFHGHCGADAVRRVVGMLAVAECDGFITGEFVDSFAVAQVHRDAVIPV